jgi:hypothetical protein
MRACRQGNKVKIAGAIRKAKPPAIFAFKE